ncbi:unnamed protein product [Arctia plantaginis]|uniref:Uncharacterized protein n=1 Tax=Arctia plantaginis TaxID=874455 RepID=A0A8S0YNC2_ARCPL|nr:unnamed protein product [Arctia plantaginis]
MLANECKSLKVIDLPSDSEEPESMESETTEARESSTDSATRDFPQISTFPNSVVSSTGRRFLPIMREGMDQMSEQFQSDDDVLLKKKIAVIIQQTVHDTTKKVTSVQKVKERVRDQPPYKAGYILSLVRKSRLMLNDLFNLAVKHRDNWKALQQLKVFEYIVHTNVDTTNLVRQLVEVHIQYLNSTQSSKKRVVLL